MKFCSQCGTSVSVSVPDGDNRERHICDNNNCATIHYQNPRVITGCLPVYDDKVLLCKRSIEPQCGYWTLPAGFMENGETTKQGAERESWEEARATLRIEALYTIFDLPHINQVYFFYKARLLDLDFQPGEESSDVQLFSEDQVPWRQLAFPVIVDTLKYYFEDQKKDQFTFRSRAITRSHRHMS
ncbi:MAG: ADP-ribose pyrophosphatase YjhB (NUDIX family) [Cellvibrionaceae bacterium]|jgi:ADP-ribose pyrophosphatase YjhB (NUDIX family)